MIPDIKFVYRLWVRSQSFFEGVFYFIKKLQKILLHLNSMLINLQWMSRVWVCPWPSSVKLVSFVWLVM